MFAVAGGGDRPWRRPVLENVSFCFQVHVLCVYSCIHCASVLCVVDGICVVCYSICGPSTMFSVFISSFVLDGD